VFTARMVFPSVSIWGKDVQISTENMEERVKFNEKEKNKKQN